MTPRTLAKCLRVTKTLDRADSRGQIPRPGMKTHAELLGPEELPPELLNLLLDEAERALLMVDARVDEPGRRLLTGQPPDDEGSTLGVPELRLALAELIDAHPGIQFDLERLNDRARSLGPSAATQELSSQPHLLDLARLSLEAFFRQYPELESYEAELEARGIDESDLERSAAETYQSMRDLREALRAWLN